MGNDVDKDITPEELLKQIIKEIENYTLSNFNERELEFKTITITEIIKEIKLCILAIRLEAFFLNFKLRKIGIPVIDILEEIYWTRKDLKDYSRIINTINREIRNPDSKTDILKDSIFVLKKISIISKMVCGRYNLIEDIYRKLKDRNKLIKKK